MQAQEPAALKRGGEMRVHCVRLWLARQADFGTAQGLSGHGFSTFSKPGGPCCQSWQPTGKGRAGRVLSCLSFFFT